MTRLVSINTNPMFRDSEGVWLSLHEWKRIAEWLGVFDELLVVKPDLRGGERPAGWSRIDACDFATLCASTDGRLARRRKTHEVLRSLLREGDILHVVAPSPEGYWGYEVASRTGTPILAEIVGDPFTSVLEEDGRSLLRNLTRQHRARPARAQQETICQSAACVISVGPVLARDYVPEGVPCLVSTVHLLEEKHYEPRTSFDLADPPQLLFVGQVQRRKGLHVLLDALAALRRQGQPFHMRIIGTGAQEGPLREQAARLGIGDCVELLGYSAHGEALFEEFKRADLFVLPSVAAEGVPRVTHEAMAFGCPVVATDVGSVAWQLRDDAGIVVPHGDPEALRAAIAELLSDSQRRRSLSERGYARSLEHTFERQRAEKITFLSDHFELEA